jgi:L-lactate utilization protein LutC
MDDEAQAELLTFLVVGQLLVRARDGVWLRTDHLIESAQMWASSNGAKCDWLERARLVAASREVAERAATGPFPTDEAVLFRLFNIKAGWFLDYRSEVVQRLHALCVEHLKHRGHQ